MFSASIMSCDNRDACTREGIFLRARLLSDFWVPVKNVAIAFKMAAQLGYGGSKVYR